MIRGYRTELANLCRYMVERNIPVHRMLKPLLEEYSMQFVSQKLFFSRGGRGVSADDYVNRVLRDTTRELKWSKKVTCHIIRHSVASSLFFCKPHN
jgi:site-specific recombinase XerD